jgi:hypothetical protein
MASRYREAGYFYDEQFRRYILQFMRLFGGLLVKTGKGKDGVEKFIKVPCRYADMQRMVGHILKNNSENVINSCPFITSHILTLQPDRARTLDPLYVDKQQIAEREFNPETGKYTDKMGNRYSVERLMPTPYTLTMQTDVWTSNADQKLQLMEQILVLFNPSIELQSSVNILDWTSLVVVELTDISWSSRGVPQGVDTQIDIGSMTFTMPVWISPPAKVYQQRVIQQVANKINDFPDDFDPNAYDFFGGQTFLTRDIFTPLNASINVSNGQIELLNYAGINDDGTGSAMDWVKYLDQYGGLKDGVTQIRLRLNTDPEVDTSPNDIVGTIATTGTGNIVDYTVDTDTLPGTAFTVNAIINPHKSYPDDGTLPVAATGQKYLILDDIGAVGASNTTDAWGNLVANKNDIIQYNGSNWVVFFDSSATEDTTYIQNNFTGDQFKWNGTQWMDSYQGRYYPGFWRIVM